MSKLSTKYEKEQINSFYSSPEKNKLSCSEQNIIPNSNYSCNEENISGNILNHATNSYSISENNDLFDSLMNSKNNKNKEFSLLYLINTFGKSYSSESKEKNKVIIDLPKISKNLFSKPQEKSSSSKNLYNVSFQKNLSIRKSISNCGIMNHFFSSIYEKQMSSGKIMDIKISGQKSSTKKRKLFNSGNKNKLLSISPFTKGNYKFGNIFNDNKEGANFDTLKNKNNNGITNKTDKINNNKFNSSLLMITFGDDLNNNNILES